MQGYKEPTYQDRVAVAQSAKNKALTQMNNRAPIDPAEQALRIANRAAKDEAQRIKRVAAREMKQATKVDGQMAKREADRPAAETVPVAPPPELNEADLKSARDARYAARKARKTGRS
jgi:hypothetical protein